MRGLELFSGKNLTCDKCCEKSKRFRERHPEKEREKVRKFARENPGYRREEKKEYMKEYNQREKECEICKCKMKIGHWSRHIKTNKHREMMEKMMGGGDENDEMKMKQPT